MTWARQIPHGAVSGLDGDGAVRMPRGRGRRSPPSTRIRLRRRPWFQVRCRWLQNPNTCGALRVLWRPWNDVSLRRDSYPACLPLPYGYGGYPDPRGPVYDRGCRRVQSRYTYLGNDVRCDNLDRSCARWSGRQSVRAGLCGYAAALRRHDFRPPLSPSVTALGPHRSVVFDATLRGQSASWPRSPRLSRMPKIGCRIV